MVLHVNPFDPPELTDTRARQLGRRSRRLVLILFIGLFAIAGVPAWAMWTERGFNPGWIAGPIGAAVTLLLVFAILVLNARLLAKRVRKTAEALPDAYLVCSASDPQLVPGVVRTLVVQLSGVSLCDRSGTRLRPKWELAWGDIATADVCEYTFKFDTRPTVRITCRDGRTKLLALEDKKRRTDALMDFPRSAAALLNEHTLP